MTEKPPHEPFGKAFFQRFYVARKTRIAAPEEYLYRARLLRAHADIYGIQVKRILDVGAGTGLFMQALTAAFPRARYQGIEVSRYACEAYGWQQASIVAFTARTPFDLVICHDVLQYLTATDAARALNNLAELSAGLL